MVEICRVLGVEVSQSGVNEFGRVSSLIQLRGWLFSAIRPLVKEKSIRSKFELNFHRNVFCFQPDTVLEESEFLNNQGLVEKGLCRSHDRGTSN